MVVRSRKWKQKEKSLEIRKWSALSFISADRSKMRTEKSSLDFEVVLVFRGGVHEGERWWGQMFERD